MNDWQLIDARQGFAANAERWARLNRRLFGDHPLLDPRFVGPLVEHFGTARTRLAILGDPADPAGMMLVDRQRAGLWSSFLPSQSQIAPVLLGRCDAHRLPALIRALPGRAIAVDLLSQDPLYSCIAGAQEPEGLAGLVESHPHVRTMSVRLDGGFEHYWGARSRTLVKNLRRYTNRLERDGVRLQLEAATDPALVAARVEHYGRLESAGWKGASGTAASPDSVQGRFYAAMMRGFAECGDAVVYSLLHGERVVACRLVVRSPAMIVILKTTYDESYRRYAVGRLLLHAVLREMFERHPGAVVEFYTNATEEQLAWATDERPIANVRVYRSALERWAFERARVAGRLARGIVGGGRRDARDAGDDQRDDESDARIETRPDGTQGGAARPAAADHR